MTLVNYDVKLDLQNDAIELFGIRYALTCFRQLGLGEPGDAFKIVSREPDGVIVLQRLQLQQQPTPETPAECTCGVGYPERMPHDATCPLREPVRCDCGEANCQSDEHC